MKLVSKLFIGGAAFYLLVAGIYWMMSHDEAGALVLVFTAGLSAMIGFYLLVTSRRMPETPEDQNDAEVDWADPDYGHFSPYSWAPLMVGAAAAITFAGLAVGIWMVALGLVAVIMTSAFWLFEYYRGAPADF
ncbi:MAG: cytochrome c oxidase subunit 4 [Candidatus Nanopelagicales bacterium]